MVQMMMPSRKAPDWTDTISPPKASSAAATVCSVMTLARRNRGCVANGRGVSGAGTSRTHSGFFKPGRVRLSAGMASSRVRTENIGETPQPAGETAPSPRTKIRLTTTSEK